MKRVSKAAGWAVICVALVAPWEGLWTTAKVDRIGTGQPLTWCYGETEQPKDGTVVKVGSKFSKQECADMLESKLPRYHDEIMRCIKIKISPQEEAAYTSGAYNFGSGAFCRSTIVRKLNSGDRVGACNALMNFVKAQGRVVKGLVNRRTAERKLCLEGVAS